MGDVFYIGVDQSISSTGVIVLNSTGDIVHMEVFGTDPDPTEFSVFHRVKFITDSVIQLFHKFSSQGIVNFSIEGLSYGSVGDATRDLAGLQFCIVTKILPLLPKENFFITEPTKLKKYATGQGRKVSKQMMFAALPDVAKATIERVKCKDGRYDLTDAFFIAKYFKDLKEGSDATTREGTNIRQ